MHRYGVLWFSAMNAIDRLLRSGLTRSEIAAGLGVTPHMVRLYARHNRFPSKKVFACFVELAEARGITLLARDFLAANDACEPNNNDS
jgi:predicted transcriptional regulator